jgi:uncharacterized protein involved in type VI secretion and phage assembly
MATMPMLSERRRHSPAVDGELTAAVGEEKSEEKMLPQVGWRVEGRRRRRREKESSEQSAMVIRFLEGSWKRFGMV